MNDLLKKEIRIMGIHDGILEKPHVAYPYGTARPYCWSAPLNGWKIPSYGATFSISLSRMRVLKVSIVVEVLFRGW